MAGFLNQKRSEFLDSERRNFLFNPQNLFYIILCLNLCYKRNDSWFGVLDQVMDALGEHEKNRLSPEATLVLFASFPNFPGASLVHAKFKMFKS